jgi:hypothetical protein
MLLLYNENPEIPENQDGYFLKLAMIWSLIERNKNAIAVRYFPREWKESKIWKRRALMDSYQNCDLIKCIADIEKHFQIQTTLHTVMLYLGSHFYCPSCRIAS